ncbi:MAG: hypothetical protein LIO53_04265 [Oscillospiraceae bacterium]|nr:hypothetical protein [Oscillospiraceae bacterium]
MTAIKIAALVIGLIALILTFKTKLVIEKVLKREPTEEMVLRVKYIALALAVIAFLSVFILAR